MAFILNEYEIDNAADRNIPGAKTLQAFKDMVNQNSDGWAYWKLAGNAAKQLQALVHSGHATPAEIAKALRPMKALCTRKSLPQTWAE